MFNRTVPEGAARVSQPAHTTTIDIRPYTFSATIASHLHYPAQHIPQNMRSTLIRRAGYALHLPQHRFPINQIPSQASEQDCYDGTS